MNTVAVPTALAWFRARIEQLEKERGMIARDISNLRAEMQANDKWTNETLVRIENKIDNMPNRRDYERLEDALGERPTRPEMVAATRSKGPELELRGPFNLFARLKRVNMVTVLLFTVIVYATITTWLLLR